MVQQYEVITGDFLHLSPISSSYLTAPSFNMSEIPPHPLFQGQKAFSPSCIFFSTTHHLGNQVIQLTLILLLETFLENLI